MSNTAVPQSTTHSYSYHVDWKYAWEGSSQQLLPAGSGMSLPTTFPVVEIRGTVEATYRDKADGPDKHCTMSVLANPAVLPSFVASYNPKRDELSITQLEAPTFQLSRFAAVDDPNCVGGPGVNIFSAPADWSPLGGGGGLVGGGEKGGTNRFNRTWQWTHTFAGGQTREYQASMQSTVEVDP